MKRIILVAVACLAVAACSGNSLSGTYVPAGGGMGNGLVMSKMEFISSDSVNLTMMEQTIRANYKIDGKSVLLIVNGQQEVFTIDNAGCLDGGNVFGKFCKS